jgi:hypothetical protein
MTDPRNGRRSGGGGAARGFVFFRPGFGGTWGNADGEEIMFHDEAVLAEWQASEECKERVAALGDPRRRQVCLWEAAERVKYGLNGFGRLPNG